MKDWQLIQKNINMKENGEDPMKVLRLVVLVLVIVGAINYGLMGVFGFDFLTKVFGHKMFGHKFLHLVYAIIGLAGVYSLTFLTKSVCCGCSCGGNCKCHKK